MICTSALKRNFFHLHLTSNWDTPLFLCTFARSAFIVGEAVFEAVGIRLPGNERRTDNQTDGCSSYIQGDRQMAVCPFREKL